MVVLKTPIICHEGFSSDNFFHRFLGGIWDECLSYEGWSKSPCLKLRETPHYLEQKSGEKGSPTIQTEIGDGEKSTFFPEVMILVHLY